MALATWTAALPLRLAALAAGATLASVLLAAPLCLPRRGRAWLVAAWLAGAPCMGGWLLVAAPRSRPMLALDTALLLVPATTLCLRGSGRDGAVLWRMAEAAGAGRLASLYHAVLRPALPGVARAALLAWASSAALLAALGAAP